MENSIDLDFKLLFASKDELAEMTYEELESLAHLEIEYENYEDNYLELPENQCTHDTEITQKRKEKLLKSMLFYCRE